jgi:hypothetical protein
MEKQPDFQSLKAKFEAEIKKNMQSVQKQDDLAPVASLDYQQFRHAYIGKHQSLYEKACNLSQKIFSFTAKGKNIDELRKAIETAHLEITPEGALSFATLAPLAFIFIFGGLALFLTNSMFLVFAALIFGGLGMLLFMKLPYYYADNWRMKGSNQMILAVFYIVTYMRHTSNFERAVEFAAQHLEPPMSLDLRKVLWNVESARYDTLTESMENYLSCWHGYNDEFIESIHLIEGSLYEESEQRRLETLDKSLDVILQQTYEKMLHYAHNLQSPITTLHMLGIILPILGLVILPLVISFMDGARWYHISVIYNVALPVIVFVMGKNILSKRPTGYGASDAMDAAYGREERPFWKSPKVLASIVFIVLFIIGASPLWMHWIGVQDIGIGEAVDPSISVCGRAYCLLDYHTITKEESVDFGKERGPFGIGAALIGLFVPMAIAFALALYYHMRTKKLIEVRQHTRKLEEEFSHAIFALGNRIGDGLPPEIALGKVAETMPSTDSGQFFMIAGYNIQKMGMSVEQAIFDKKHGALAQYPSTLIESSMKVLIQSAKKGPKIASQALMNISRYLNEVHKVNERLKDLMGEVISSMKSQINFLTPIIAGIVIGITSMIGMILSRLSGTLSRVTQSTETGGVGVNAGAGLLTMFGDGIPTYFFQLIVGLYVVQIVFILTILVNGIENGVDPLQQRWLLAKNMLKSVGLYLVVSGAVIILFNLIAGQILSAL